MGSKGEAMMMVAKTRKTALFIGLIALMFILVTSLAVARSVDTLNLTWSTIDGGGGVSGNGDYALAGTIGQPDAGEMSEGNFTLYGGFWQDGLVIKAPDHTIYLPFLTNQ